MPLPTLTISASPSNVTDVNVSIAFAASVAGGTTPGNSSWTFGDGSSAWGATVDHEYAAAGVYLRDVPLSGWIGSQREPLPQRPGQLGSLRKIDRRHGAPELGGYDGHPTPVQHVHFRGHTTGTRSSGHSATGSYGSGISSQHSYAEAGTYLVTLIVNDSAGAGWSTTYRLVVAAAPGPSALGTQFETGLLLGLLVGAAVAALILFIAPRSKRRPPPSPPTAYVPPADPADGPAWREG